MTDMIMRLKDDIDAIVFHIAQVELQICPTCEQNSMVMQSEDFRL